MKQGLNQSDLSRPAEQFMWPVETAIRADGTIAAALDSLRARKIDRAITYFYAVDADGRLLGVMPTRRLLLESTDQRVEDLMERPPICVRGSSTLGEAMELFALHHLLALPVVDDDGKLIGQLDVELYAEEAVDVAEKHRVIDLFQLIGLSVQQVRQGSAWAGFKIRMPWLLFNIMGGIMCAVIANHFRLVLSEVLLLAMFIPLVLTLSEAVSMQSMTMSLQYLRGRVRWGMLLRRGAKEWRTGVLLGLCSGLLVGLAATFWSPTATTVAAIFLSIAASMLAAATIGTSVPMILHALKLDPKVAAGPVVLMMADTLTTFVYLGLATSLLLG